MRSDTKPWGNPFLKKGVPLDPLPKNFCFASRLTDGAVTIKEKT